MSKNKILIGFIYLILFSNRTTYASSSEEEKALANHPIYHEIQTEKNELYKFKPFQIAFITKVVSFNNNTGSPIKIGTYNLTPVFGLNAQYWINRSYGFELEHESGLIFIFPKLENNSNLLRPQWNSANIVYKIIHDYKENGSHLLFKLGIFNYTFNLNLSDDSEQNDTIFKTRYNGITLGTEAQLLLAKNTGFNFNFALIPIFDAKDESKYDVADEALGYHMGLHFFTSVYDKKNSQTLIQTGYTQKSYASSLNTTFKETFKKDHYEQLYMGFDITLVAKF